MPKEEKNKDTSCCFHISGKIGKSTMPMEEPQKKSWLFQYHVMVRISRCSRDQISFVPMAGCGSFLAHLLFSLSPFYSHLNLVFFKRI